MDRYMSALEIGRLVNKHEVSAVDVIRFFLHNIAAHDEYKAFVYLDEESALSDAEALDKRIANGEYVGPFAGVPVGLKDFLPSKKGWTNTHGGVKALRAVDDADSAFYAAVRGAGGIAIGKTNAPPFGFSGACYNKLYGSTKNPYNTKYNSGGSSGGSAAAVGGCLVPMCEGGDAGGSIRIPAAWCNCFGFKASVGTVPNVNRPDGWAATHPFCMGGGITRTVDDAATLLDYMAGYVRRDPYSVPNVLRPDSYYRRCAEDIYGLRVAVTHNYGVFTTDPEISRKVDEIARFFEYGGAKVDYVNMSMPYTADQLADTWCTMISMDTALDLARWKSEGLDLINDHRDELAEGFIYYNNKAAKLGLEDMLFFNKVRTAVLDAHESVFDNYDIILGPVSATGPLKDDPDLLLPGVEYIEVNGELVNPVIAFGETFLVNFIGYPAASVPAGMLSNGLPVGVHLIGPKYRDLRVLQAAKFIETEYGWADTYKKMF